MIDQKYREDEISITKLFVFDQFTTIKTTANSFQLRKHCFQGKEKRDEKSSIKYRISDFPYPFKNIDDPLLDESCQRMCWTKRSISLRGKLQYPSRIYSDDGPC